MKLYYMILYDTKLYHMLWYNILSYDTILCNLWQYLMLFDFASYDFFYYNISYVSYDISYDIINIVYYDEWCIIWYNFKIVNDNTVQSIMAFHMWCFFTYKYIIKVVSKRWCLVPVSSIILYYLCLIQLALKIIFGFYSMVSTLEASFVYH